MVKIQSETSHHSSEEIKAISNTLMQNEEGETSQILSSVMRFKEECFK